MTKRKRPVHLVGHIALSDGLFFDINRLREIAWRNAQHLGLVDKAAPLDPALFQK